MSQLKKIREQKNFTQEELAEKSGISVRTIQRIEAGREPKGFTLKTLAKSLEINETELLNNTEKETEDINFSYIKIINLSSVLFTILPPLNILIPFILSKYLKQKNQIVKEIISVQTLWTIIAPIVFMIGIFLKLGNKFTLILIITILLSNIFIILRNASEIDRKKKLYFKLNFNML